MGSNPVSCSNCCLKWSIFLARPQFAPDASYSKTSAEGWRLYWHVTEVFGDAHERDRWSEPAGGLAAYQTEHERMQQTSCRIWTVSCLSYHRTGVVLTTFITSQVRSIATSRSYGFNQLHDVDEGTVYKWLLNAFVETYADIHLRALDLSVICSWSATSFSIRI